MKIVIGMIAAVATLTASAALAQVEARTDRVTLTRSVSYADLNLATPDGQATLDRRVAGAIRRICPRPDSSSLRELADHQRCTAEARASIEPQITALKANKPIEFATNTKAEPRLAP
jgi:UrcA family protein